MHDLKFKEEVLEEGPQGLILRIAFEGVYPLGSQGNAHARKMQEHVREVVLEYQPDAVLFDMTGLHYEFGNAIGGIVYGLHKGEGFRFREILPCCIVATGRTAKALEWFFEHGSGHILHLASMHLVDALDAGTEFLRCRLAAG